MSEYDEEGNARLLQEICYLTDAKTKNYVKLLELGKTINVEVKRKLLWMWPTYTDLATFKEIVEKLGILRILSVGCGNGLLEWLLRESTDIRVDGLEIDRNWWQSKYVIRNFINLNYFDDLTANCNHDGYWLRHFCAADDWNFALMFCYFNNHKAFLEYLTMYQGKWLILIGPYPCADLYTEPEPLNPNFPADMSWQLRCQLNWTEQNVVAFYERLS